MNAWFALFRKTLMESRWLLGLICLALFGLSWLSVQRNYAGQERMKNDPATAVRARMFLSTAGGPNMDGSSGAMEALILYWLFLTTPVILVVTWSISRGTGAIAGEIERGSLDMVMSRPISRTSFVTVQVAVALLGFFFMTAALLIGNFVGLQVHVLDEPPKFLAVFRPALNLVLFGAAIFGYTLALSSIDIVRWRPTMIAATFTLFQFIILALANQPNYENLKWMNNWTIFTTFQPIEAAVKAFALVFNGWLLVGICVVGSFLSTIAFNVRDLPSNS